MNKKGILVTGGSGLVGAYVVAMLLERGERPILFDVAVNERLLTALGVEPQALGVVRGDILDLPALIGAIRDHGVDRIIHLAALLGEEVQRRPYSGVRLNLMGTVNVLEAARLEGVARVIFPSSGTVYLGSLGEGIQKIDEHIPVNPPSVYAATKASSEFLGRTYAQRYGFEFICLRYAGGLYGPSPVALKATRERAIQEMIRAALKGEALEVKWPYAATELLYGKDAAKATVLACLKEKFRDRLFHIGSGELSSGEDVVDAIKRYLPAAKISLVRTEKPMPYPETRIPSDLSRAGEQLGYQRDYPLERAIGDYAQTLKKIEGI